MPPQDRPFYLGARAERGGTCIQSRIHISFQPLNPLPFAGKRRGRPYVVSRQERPSPRAAVYDRVLHATFESACFGHFFFSYAPSRDAIPSRRGQPCVKRMVVVSFEEHDLHMLAASWPAGFAVLRVGGCHIRSGWEWSRCLGAEPEGHLDATARCRR